MFDKLRKYFKYLNHLNSNQEKNFNKNLEPKIRKKIENNLLSLKRVFSKNNDVKFRNIKIGTNKEKNAFICFIEGLVNEEKINHYVTKALMIDSHAVEQDQRFNKKEYLELIKNNIISISEVNESNSFNQIVSSILSGDSALFIDGYDTVLIINTKGWKTRNINEPDTEVTVRGPREGFNENLRDSITLIRRKIKNSDLIFETLRLGKQTNTDVCIVYIDGIANEKIVREVKNRLNKIDTDSILESGYIEQFIEDHPYSPFATIGNSEKPDKVAAKILEGRIAILCDGTPFVLTVPYLFIESLQVSEDYYSRAYLSSLIRCLRLLAFFITLTLPSIYISLVTFHQEMIPTVLLITAAASREGMPFPAFLETLIMLTIFELLRESGIRLPKQVGQAVSIVGALVIGEEAVKAGIISSPMVIIGALTAITSFIVPALLDGLIPFRLLLVVLSATFGLYGIVIGLIIMLGYLCSLRSFGAPFLTPMAPTIWSELKDSFVRFPLWLLDSRPKSVTWKESKKQSKSLKPDTPYKRKG